jgi:FKBP-type peptidyl-prolyl cis-trans isomerase FkpA
MLSLLIAIPSFAAEGPKNEDEKTLYAIGLTVARSLSVFNLSPAELEYVKQGITDAVEGKKPAVDLTAYTGKVQELAHAAP